MASYSDCLQNAGLTIFNHDEPICTRCGFKISDCMCNDAELNREYDEAMDDIQSFVETLKTLKRWEWELVAEHMPFELVYGRLTKEVERLQEFEAAVKLAVKESEH